MKPSIVTPEEALANQAQASASSLTGANSQTAPLLSKLLPPNVQPIFDENGLPIPNTYLMDGETIVSGEQLVEKEMIPPGTKEQLDTITSESRQNTGTPVTFDRTQTGFVLLPEIRQNLAQTLSEFPLPAEVKQGILDGTISAEHLLQQIKTILPDLTDE